MTRYDFMAGVIAFVVYMILAESEWGKKLDSFCRTIIPVVVGVTLAQFARVVFG